jgi:hypothetical protein
VTDDSVQCEAERHAIERDKAAAGQAQAAGDEATASQKRQDVGLAAHIARGLAGCDISDLVGPSVGQ